MTCLFCLNTLSEAVGNDQTVRDILPIIKELTGDNVPNVRFNVAKSLLRIGKVVSPAVLQSEIKPLLTKLAADTDFDVKFFTEETKNGQFPMRFQLKWRFQLSACNHSMICASSIQYRRANYDNSIYCIHDCAYRQFAIESRLFFVY